MAKNGNAGPVFYTDEDRTLFLVTLPCHAELTGIVTKSGTKSVTKLTREEIDEILAKNIDLQALNNILEFDISDVVDYVREKIGTKSAQKVSKSAKKVSKSIEIIDFLKSEQSREEILKHLGLINHTSNFKNYIKPLLNLTSLAFGGFLGHRKPVSLKHLII